MELIQQSVIAIAAQQFPLGQFFSAEPWGSGHINDSFRIEYSAAGVRRYSLLQRINHHIFTNPVALMENIERVTAHLAHKLDAKQTNGHAPLIPLKLHRTATGASYYRDEEGYYWRSFEFIANARSFDKVQSAAQAHQAAYAFGSFARDLADLPTPRLNDTIPNFHHGPLRFAALEAAIQADPVARGSLVEPELEFVFARRALLTALLDADLPERITHNDTKLNNVLLAESTGQAVAVIDLDTVMPGLIGYDFGDLVRTSTATALEDEQDLSLVEMNFEIFEGLTRGFVAATKNILTADEKSHLVLGGLYLPFLIGIRFLTDHINGDHYFKIARPNHNLDRARTQFKLVSSIERQRSQMESLVASIV